MASEETPLEKAENCRSKGNELLKEGDYADACLKYDEGLLALTRASESERERANELRLFLHLNASEAHLRRSNLRSAVDHASGAIALDAQSEKGYFRRASAYSRLSEHVKPEENAKLAIADFKKVLELNPKNKDANDQVRSLREVLKKEEKDVSKSQKETYKNMFGSGKQLYDMPASPAWVAPIIRDIAYEGKKCLAELDNVAFYYNRGEPVLEGVNLKLHRGHCVGIFGNNASGKTTLARLLCGQFSPTAGEIKDLIEGKSSSAGSSILMSTSAAVAAALGAIALSILGRAALGHDILDAASWIIRAMRWSHWTALAIFAAVIGISASIFLSYSNSRRRKFSIRHVSSDTADKEDITGRLRIEQVIGDSMPKSLKPDERRRRVIAMLSAAGFQMYNQETGEPVGTPEEYIRDGLTYGVLSGGQKHLMYVLRNFAACPDVLVCDELLGGLDAFRQPRVLHMVRRMKEELGTCVVFIGCELSQLRLMCDTIAFLSGGVVCELGTGEDVLDLPKHPATKEYVANYRGLPGCHIIGGKLAENYTALNGDKALSGDWLPTA